MISNKELQYKIVKAVVEDEILRDLKNSKDPVLLNFDWEGFERFRSFVSNSRIRIFYTAFPMTLKYLGENEFLELTKEYNSLFIFKNQSIQEDLQIFVQFMNEKFFNQPINDLISYELVKYTVSSEPYTAQLFKARYNVINSAYKKWIPQTTIYLFEQRSYIDNLRVYEIDGFLYKWLRDVELRKERNIEYYQEGLTAKQRKEFIEGYTLITNLNIPKMLCQDDLVES